MKVVWTDAEVNKIENTAYVTGIAVGERMERERIIDLVDHTLWLVGDEQHIPRLCEGCDFIELIKGENE